MKRKPAWLKNWRNAPRGLVAAKTSIHPAVLQQHLESASNASAKGQAQYFTPREWARALALPLASYRPVAVDLTCGRGDLLSGIAPSGGRLGCDIQPFPGHLAADIVKFYPLLKAVDFEADCFALNPPWDLHWPREALEELIVNSKCVSAAVAFTEHDGRVGKGEIDSTVATLCMALDLCSTYGEGFLIGNESTLQRLILSPGAPHGALAEHVWAHLVIDGNICQTKGSATHNSFKTGIVYFARDHTSGLASETDLQCAGLDGTQSACEALRRLRLQFRKGAEARHYQCTLQSSHLWNAAAEEWQRVNGLLKTQAWNLWLEDGRVRTALSLFDEASGRVDKTQAGLLFQLNGKMPMQLVVQRAHRKALMEAVAGHSPWRVDPALVAAVDAALADYNRQRAPLYPLSKVMRLGYLDEQDAIHCVKDLAGEFLAGKSYTLRSMTVRVRRLGTRTNTMGLTDAVEYNGQELGLFIANEDGVERLFMEERLRQPDTTVAIEKPGGRALMKALNIEELQVCPIDFTLQELAGHFEIPDVPDVATLDPDGYHKNLELLDEIERMMAA